jgi:Ca2+-binding RTX toxin-like protein
MASVLSQFYRNILSVGSATPQEGTNGNDPLPVWVGGQHYHNGLDENDTITNILPLAGNSYIEGGKGADTLTGGLLTEDTIGYLNSQFGVDVTLTAAGGITVNAWSGDAAGDIIAAGFENLVGSNNSDLSLRGNDSANKILGMGGDDDIYGRGGNDTLYGGDGQDRIYGEDGNDYLYGENGRDVLRGGYGNDVLDAGPRYSGGPHEGESLLGGQGDDILYSLGNCSLDGGAGIDTVDYSKSPGDENGATINLKTRFGDHDAAGDIYTNIENVVGTNFNDDIWGNAQANTMTGRSGRDRYYYQDLADLNGDIITDLSVAQGDYIDLTGVRGVFHDDVTVTESNMQQHFVKYSITEAGQSALVTVFYQGTGAPGIPDVFGV